MTTYSSRAERFQERVFDTYDADTMSPSDHEYLTEVLEVMTFLDRLREQIAAADDLTEVRTGGLRMSPLVVEARLQAQHLASLLRHFPAIGEDE